jgi:Flp pilus assembly protein TadD
MKILRSVFLILIIAFLIYGCGGGQGTLPTVSRDGEYQRMLELQKQKANIVDQEIAHKQLPEMRAEDHDMLGDRYMRWGDTSHAFLEYHKALSMKPELTSTRYKMGRLILEKGRVDEAMAEFEIIEKQDPKNALAHLGKGMVMFAKGDLNEARVEFEESLSRDEKLWEAHAFLGLIHDRDNGEVALVHHRKAIELNPGSAALCNNLGMSYYLRGDYGQAVISYRKGLSIDPSNSRIYNNLGLAFSKMGNYKQALESFKMARDEAGAYNNIGYLYLGEQKYEDAAKMLEKAIELKPSFYTKAHENMEMVTAGAKIEE